MGEESLINSWIPTFTHSGVPYSTIDVKVRCFHSTASVGSDSVATHRLSNDTQASFGITNCLDLFGGVPLRTDVQFNVVDWAGEERIIRHHGMTVFGPMLYSEGCTGTILCADDVYRHWRCSYGEEELHDGHPPNYTEP